MKWGETQNCWALVNSDCCVQPEIKEIEIQGYYKSFPNFLSRKFHRIWCLKMWILWKMRLWNCEFCKNWDFQDVNFWINWGFVPQCVIGYLKLHHCNYLCCSNSGHFRHLSSCNHGVHCLSHFHDQNRSFEKQCYTFRLYLQPTRPCKRWPLHYPLRKQFHRSLWE